MSPHSPNSSGGHLIYGMKEGDDEKEGLPVEVCGFTPFSSVDQLISTMQNLIRDGVEKSLYGYRIKPLKTESGQEIIVMYVPSSVSKPHWVSLYGLRKFYIRLETNSCPLDFDGLQQLFTLSETAAERIRDFRAERIGAILEGSTPIPESGPKLAVQIVPFSAGSNRQLYDLSYLPNPLKNNLAYNFEGLIESNGRDYYYQVFRDGSVEYVESYVPRANEKLVPVTDFENGVRNYFLPKAFEWQRFLGVSPPCFIMLSLLNIKMFKIALSHESITLRPRIDKISPAI